MRIKKYTTFQTTFMVVAFIRSPKEVNKKL